MKNDAWDEETLLKDYLFNTNLSLKEIATELEWTDYKLSKEIKRLGLTWVRRKNKKMSRGHAALYHMLQRIVPNERVVTEHHVGEQLRLDIYCPALKIAIEFHGRQHFYFVEHFHKTLKGFEESQERDLRKEELCQEQGIALVVFRYNDNLDEDTVFERILDAVKATKAAVPKQTTQTKFKGNPYYEASKQRNREWRKEQYRKMKAQKKRDQ